MPILQMNKLRLRNVNNQAKDWWAEFKPRTQVSLFVVNKIIQQENMRKSGKTLKNYQR